MSNTIFRQTAISLPLLLEKSRGGPLISVTPQKANAVLFLVKRHPVGCRLRNCVPHALRLIAGLHPSSSVMSAFPSQTLFKQALQAGSGFDTTVTNNSTLFELPLTVDTFPLLRPRPPVFHAGFVNTITTEFVRECFLV